jgi:hypothetical protein
MGLKTAEHCYVQTVLLAGYQIVIIREGKDANYKDRKIEEYENWGLKIVQTLRMNCRSMGKIQKC